MSLTNICQNVRGLHKSYKRNYYYYYYYYYFFFFLQFSFIIYILNLYYEGRKIFLKMYEKAQILQVPCQELSNKRSSLLKFSRLGTQLPDFVQPCLLL